MGNLDQNVFGPDDNRPLNIANVGKILNENGVFLTSQYMQDQYPGNQLSVRVGFRFDATYINAGILYGCSNPIFDADGNLVDAQLERIAIWGKGTGQDTLTRTFDINGQPWTRANPGGTGGSDEVSYFFTSWHKFTEADVNDSAIPWLQNHIKTEKITYEATGIGAEFEFEDLTSGETEPGGFDFNDIKMKFKASIVRP